VRYRAAASRRTFLRTQPPQSDLHRARRPVAGPSRVLPEPSPLPRRERAVTRSPAPRVRPVHLHLCGNRHDAVRYKCRPHPLPPLPTIGRGVARNAGVRATTGARHTPMSPDRAVTMCHGAAPDRNEPGRARRGGATWSKERNAERVWCPLRRDQHLGPSIPPARRPGSPVAQPPRSIVAGDGKPGTLTMGRDHRSPAGCPLSRPG